MTVIDELPVPCGVGADWNGSWSLADHGGNAGPIDLTAPKLVGQLMAALPAVGEIQALWGRLHRTESDSSRLSWRPGEFDRAQPNVYRMFAMAGKFLEIAFTDSVRKAQEHYFGRSQHVQGAAEYDELTDDEISFIGSRDSFYLATVSESGWPYMQHRGGAPGFLHVINPTSLAFADYRGNRQMLSTGNLAVNDRVCLFLMDYPQRARLKILGHARVEDAREHPEMVKKFSTPDVHRVVERIFLIQVVSYDWNCQKFITPRYTAVEVERAVQPLRERILELEAQLKARS